jgi:hypothetical protein
VSFYGLTPVAAGGQCDATLRVEFSGTALSDVYGSARQQLYVGYDVNGQVTLSAPNQPTLSHPFAAHHDPGESEVVRDPPPTDPMDALVDVPFFMVINDALTQFLGQPTPSTTTT